eukprot:2096517-Prymnesium_polylepis.2
MDRTDLYLSESIGSRFTVLGLESQRYFRPVIPYRYDSAAPGALLVCRHIRFSCLPDCTAFPPIGGGRRVSQSYCQHRIIDNKDAISGTRGARAIAGVPPALMSPGHYTSTMIKQEPYAFSTDTTRRPCRLARVHVCASPAKRSLTHGRLPDVGLRTRQADREHGPHERGWKDRNRRFEQPRGAVLAGLVVLLGEVNRGQLLFAEEGRVFIDVH